MLRKMSFRKRYLLSFLLILIPVVLFLSVIGYIYNNNNIHYTNNTTLEKFTYATENISNILAQMDACALSAEKLETNLVRGQNGRVSVRNDSLVVEELERAENQFVPQISALYYLRGDENIYTSEGKVRYSFFETGIQGRYDLNRSRLFSRMMYLKVPLLMPVMDGKGESVALSYIYPLSSDGLNWDAVLLFFLTDDVMQNEFVRYLGSIPGDLHVFNTAYMSLITCLSEDEPLLDFETVSRQNGVGVQTMGDLITVSVKNPVYGLNFTLVSRSSVFYGELEEGNYRIRVLAAITLGTLLILFAYLTFFNYKPIRGLMNDITGKNQLQGVEGNELEFIRDYYTQSVENLEMQLAQLTPHVTRTFVQKLVRGKITNRAEYDTLSRYAGISFTAHWFCTLYLLMGRDTNMMDDVLQLISHFEQEGVGLIYSELEEENAVCLVVNYNAPGGREQIFVREMGERLLTQLRRQTVSFTRLGIGMPRTDPLEMRESFAEAGVAAQMSREEAICVYTPENDSLSDENGTWQGFDKSLAFRLTEAVHMGDHDSAVTIVEEMLRSMGDDANSVLIFRFYTGNLVNLLLRTAMDEKINVSKKQVQTLLSCQDAGTFKVSADEFIGTLCDEVGKKQVREQSEISERVMNWILTHYKDWDLSIQTVADGAGIRKTQVTAILRDNLGLNLVQYVSYLRMQEFKRLLTETDRPINELVIEIGYSDVSNFLRKFKVTEGVTPGQYRNTHKEK